LGISSRGGCLWPTYKDYRKLVSIIAHCENSVSGLALDFCYGLALDFGLDLMQPVNWQPQCALLYRVYTIQLIWFPAIGV
jgi:hypothetical protein